jgi:hypothetical protein
MDTLTPESVIHFYDTRLHETLCGLRGFEHRSTKHAHGVTCQKCVGLLRERQRPPAATTPGARAGGVPTAHGVA